MALVVATLESELLAKVTGNIEVVPGQTAPERSIQVGLDFAAAYATYAKEAASCGGTINPTTLVTAQQACAAAFTAAIAPSVAFPTAAQAMVTALDVFWVNPLLWLPIPPAGPATLVVPVGSPVLLTGLIVQLGAFAAGLPATMGPTPEQAAAALAGLIDAYTRLVTVTHSLSVPPFVCVAPIF